QEAERATFLTHQKISVIIIPANTKEVLACVKIASKFKIPLYPISTGKNWGNGSKVSVYDGSVLMDLSRMNRIVEYDEHLAYVTIEPGVTQKQVIEFLNSQKSLLSLGVTGSVEDSSIIGNVIERGDATGVYGERCLHVCGFEVVLPNGKLIRTGFERFLNSACGPLHRHGLGPSLDGLFLQSNLGIITRMTIWLEPKPSHIYSVIVAIEDEKQLKLVLDKLQGLFLKNAFQNLTIWNDIKIFSRLGQYPYELAKNQTPLPPKIRLQWRKKYQVTAWMGFISVLTYTENQAMAQIEMILQEFKDDNLHLEISKEEVESNALGNNQKNVQLAYWRKKYLPETNFDLDKDGCGLIWCMNVLSFQGADALLANQIAEDICNKHSFESNIAIIATENRTLKFLVAVIYDRHVKNEDKKAMRCYRELALAFKKAGYMPYRLGIQGMDMMQSDFKDYEWVMRGLKKVFDPSHILSPGRYDFTPSP
ncbi:FAD-binding oxidoreductase, partial [Candidatus Dependentiae bacterium]|nr:FAD-binding oxidoreductase [Candidatus Dependentiae bacterium]